MHFLSTSRDAVSTAPLDSLLQCWWVSELHLSLLCHHTWSSISHWNWAQQLQGCWASVTLSHSPALTHPVFNPSHWLPYPKPDAFPGDARLLSMPSGCALPPLCPDHPQFSTAQLLLKATWLLSSWTTWRLHWQTSLKLLFPFLYNLCPREQSRSFRELGDINSRLSQQWRLLCRKLHHLNSLLTGSSKEEADFSEGEIQKLADLAKGCTLGQVMYNALPLV